MFRRPRLTAQEKADLKWERMASQPKTMGMVGIFNDLNPGAIHAAHEIAYQREAVVDQESAGDGPAAAPEDGLTGLSGPDGAFTVRINPRT